VNEPSSILLSQIRAAVSRARRVGTPKDIFARGEIRVADLA